MRRFCFVLLSAVLNMPHYRMRTLQKCCSLLLGAALAGRRGIHLSIEAMLSMVLLAALVAAPSSIQEQDFSSLQVLQKQNDLLGVWIKERDFSKETFSADFRVVFPTGCGSIEADNTKHALGSNCGNAWKRKSVADAFYARDDLTLGSMRLTVYH